jgi:hypothetical protein
MCLAISVTVPSEDRAALEAAALAAAAEGLHLRVTGPSIWPWAKDRPASVYVTEDGGCGCSLFAGGDDGSDDPWEFRLDLVDSLAATLLVLARGLANGCTVDVGWDGDRPRFETAVTPAQLADGVRRGLRKDVRYVVGAASGAG